MNEHSYGPCAVGTLNESYFPVCREYHEVKLAQREKDAVELGVPMIISEFGACVDGATCITEITSLTDVCDEHLAGWAYWQFKSFGDLTTTAGTGNEGFYTEGGWLLTEKVKALARTYVQAAQGTLVSMKFNTSDSEFQASILVNLNVTAPTVIFWSNAYYYLDGYSLSVADADGNLLQEDQDYKAQDLYFSNYIELTIINPALNGKVVALRLSPMQALPY